MQTKRDQVQAYLFVIGRLRSALLRSEPDLVETPLKRTSVGLFGGTFVAILIVVGAVLWGLLFPGAAKNWRTDGTVVVDTSSGARYLYTGGVLRPVLNSASAWLVTGSRTKVRRVSPKSLAGVPHGDALGIPGAPDALPEAKQLTVKPWVACSPQAPDAGGTLRPGLTLLVDPAVAVTAVGVDRGMLVRTPDGTSYVLWRDRRMQVPDRAALIALGYAGTPPAPVSTAFLDGFAAAPDLRPVPVPGRGGPGPALSGVDTRVGQVLRVQIGATETFYTVLPDGLAPLSRTAAQLMLGDPDSAAAYGGGRVEPVQVDPAAVAAEPPSTREMVSPAWPAEPPRMTDPAATGTVPCVRVTPGRPGPDVTLASAPAAGLPVAPGPAVTGVRAVVPGGGGALVRALSAPGVGGGTVYLLTDTGRKYALGGAQVAESLGYGGVVPVPVPTTLLALVADGPVLDPAAAAQVPTVVGPEAGSGAAQGGP